MMDAGLAGAAGLGQQRACGNARRALPCRWLPPGGHAAGQPQSPGPFPAVARASQLPCALAPVSKRTAASPRAGVLRSSSGEESGGTPSGCGQPCVAIGRLGTRAGPPQAPAPIRARPHSPHPGPPPPQSGHGEGADPPEGGGVHPLALPAVRHERAVEGPAAQGRPPRAQRETGGASGRAARASRQPGERQAGGASPLASAARNPHLPRSLPAAPMQLRDAIIFCVAPLAAIGYYCDWYTEKEKQHHRCARMFPCCRGPAVGAACCLLLHAACTASAVDELSVPHPSCAATAMCAGSELRRPIWSCHASATGLTPPSRLGCTFDGALACNTAQASRMEAKGSESSSGSSRGEARSIEH